MTAEVELAQLKKGREGGNRHNSGTESSLEAPLERCNVQGLAMRSKIEIGQGSAPQGTSFLRHSGTQGAPIYHLVHLSVFCSILRCGHQETLVIDVLPILCHHLIHGHASVRPKKRVCRMGCEPESAVISTINQWNQWSHWKYRH